MRKNIIPFNQEVASAEADSVPPKIDLDKLKDLQVRAAIAREKALLQISIIEAERIPQTLEAMNQLEQEIEKDVITVEQRLMFLAARQRIVDSGREFLADREKKFIEGNDTTSRLDKLQRENNAPMMNSDVDRVKLNEIKSAVENAIRQKIKDRK